jgi:hypothetical protein
MPTIQLDYTGAEIDANLAKAATAIQWVTAPIAADSAGTAGHVAYADGFFYICVATNTWQRAVIETWGA